MNFPAASDYQDAIQNPATCFENPDLRTGKPALTKIGLPRVASGNFASVYEIRTQSQRWAIRCFLRQGADQQSRYALLSQLLNRITVPGLVGFAYLPQGIRIRGQWYPIVRMEWVEGETLDAFIGKHLHETEALRTLALQWRGLMERLRLHRIAHADLQHGNVLVTPQGQLRLVDYDGMFVPALRGQASHELGHPNFQHPRRTAADFNESLDNFSALVIYTSLLALIADPRLWQQHYTGENLIFSAKDFKAPAQSPLFQQLLRSEEPAVRLMTERLAQACEGTVAQVPDFKAVSEALPALPERKPWWHNVTDAMPAQPEPKKTASKKQPSPPPTAPPTKPAVPSTETPPPGGPWWSGKPPGPQAAAVTRPGQTADPPPLCTTRAASPEKLSAQDLRPPVARAAAGCLNWMIRACVLGFFLLLGTVLGARYLFQQARAFLATASAAHSAISLSHIPARSTPSVAQPQSIPPSLQSEQAQQPLQAAQSLHNKSNPAR